ncbi:MAG: hypothetical protein H7Y37_15615 [Anaerolineae bacterium]|nr:hypothetical protein [Gloeobacterales cyanobacterium ES-bin-313]
MVKAPVGSKSIQAFRKEVKKNLLPLLGIAVASIPVHIFAHKVFDFFLETNPIGWHSSPESLFFPIPAFVTYLGFGWLCSKNKRLQKLNKWTLGMAMALPTLLFSLCFSVAMAWTAYFEGTIPFDPYLGIFIHLYLSSLVALVGGALGSAFVRNPQALDAQKAYEYLMTEEQVPMSAQNVREKATDERLNH